LSHFSDKEGKTRVIAILDYWSQCALKPIHDELNFILRRLRCDCTFDQNKFVTLLKDKPVYYSLDLTAATDRFPITFTKKLMEVLLGAQKAQAWVDTLVGLEFNEGIRYAAGQPMGAYSS